MPSEAPTWSAHAPDPDDVREWICSSLQGHPPVEGPILIYRAHQWGLTARFALNSHSEAAEVVFKASFLPPAFTVCAPYRLLERYCAGLVPELLASIDEPGRRWMLFSTFEGLVMGSLQDPRSLPRIARTMARIQAAVAYAQSGEPGALPKVPVSCIPRMYDELANDVRNRYLTVWKAKGAEFLREVGIPEDAAERLESYRPRVQEWATELERDRWPLSIHHVDLHPNNAVLKPDGQVLIYDWEEADLSFPLFSLDKLLLAAEDVEGGGSPTPAVAVRSAYLETLPWRTREERERAFDLALLLSPIRYAYADKLFAEALGWNAAEPVATWVALALERWDEAAF
jgi:hypothetical protein